MPGPGEMLTTAPGSYVLFIRLAERRVVRVAALGAIGFEPGLYLYAGSARGPGGVRARVARHLLPRSRKRLRWHVDYMLAAPGTSIVAVECFADEGGRGRPGGGAGECEIVRGVLRRLGARAPVAGFGSSDCTAGCPAHLLKIT